MSVKENLQPLGAQNFVALNDVALTSLSGEGNKILRVNALGTGIDAISGPDAIGFGATLDIPVFSGTTPVLTDSNVSISHAFGQAIIKPTNNMESLTLNSTDGAVRVKSDTSSVFIDADQTTGGVTLTSYNQQHIAYGNISLSANGQITIQAGGGTQILLDSFGNVSISPANGGKLELKANGGSSNWVFDGASTSGGNLVFPTSAPVGECVLKVNSIDNLMYWDPVIGP